MNEQDRLVADIADRMAIADLVVNYAKARDTTDPDLYRQIFAGDAVIALADGRVMSKDLAEILAKVTTDQVRFNPGKRPGAASYGIMRHEVSNVTVELAGDAARSDYYIDTLAYNEAAKRPEIIAAGRNEDEYRRENGRWWITRSTLIFGWEHEEMGKALKLGPYTPAEYRR